MNRLPAILIAVAIFFLIDFYVFQAVRTLTKSLSADSRKLIHYIYWAVPIMSLVVWIVTQFLMPPDALSRVVRQFIWTAILIPYFAKIFMVVVLLIDDLVRLVKWVAQWVSSQWSISPLPSEGGNTKTDPTIHNPNFITHNSSTISRSEFLMKSALAVGGTTVAGFAYGIVSGAHDYRIRRVSVPIKNLPSAFHGIRIAQLSDIHSGSFFNKTAVKGGVEMLLKEKPDIAFFTGDLVNNTADEVKNYIDIFNKVKAPLGVYSVLGNHDYGDYYQWDSLEDKQRNLNDLIEAHRLLGWGLLMDEHRFIKVDNEKLAIIGIQNWGGSGFAKYGNLKKACTGTQDVGTKILLSHDPSHWDAQTRTMTPDIDLTLAGHTHGMQFGVEVGNFKWSPVQFRYKQWAGLYTEANQHLYVNRGFGYIGYPGRIGMLPEITILELVKG